MRGSRYVAALALALTACGGSGDPKPSATTAPPTTPPPTTAAPTSAAPTTTEAPSRMIVQLTLAQAVLAEESYRIGASSYTTDVSALVAEGFEAEPGVELTVLSADAERYCMKAVGGGVTLYFETGSNGASEKPCS